MSPDDPLLNSNTTGVWRKKNNAYKSVVDTYYWFMKKIVWNDSVKIRNLSTNEGHTHIVIK